MVGANFAGISKVFGDEAEIKSCEFHFKDHRNKKAQKLNSKSNGEFKQLCDRLLPSLIWTSMSPSIYELIITPPTVRKCYGYGNDLGDKYKTPPCNIIIKHVDKRVTGKDSATGQLIHSQDYSNTYYHPIAAHITKKNPPFSGQVYVRYELYNSLDDDQSAITSTRVTA